MNQTIIWPVVIGIFCTIAIVSFLVKNRKKALVIFKPLIWAFTTTKDEKVSIGIKIANYVLLALMLAMAVYMMIGEQYSFAEIIVEATFTSLIAIWCIAALIKIIILVFIRYWKTRHAWVLIVSTIMIANLLYLKSVFNIASLFDLAIAAMIIINLIMIARYMAIMCLQRENYMEDEFGQVTAINQFAAIIMIVVLQLTNFIELVYYLANYSSSFSITSCGKEVKALKDVIYYVVITYSTVGYGDIVPNDYWAKAISCFISISSLFTTVILVGVILNTTIRKYSTGYKEKIISGNELTNKIKRIKLLATNNFVKFSRRCQSISKAQFDKMIDALSNENYEMSYFDEDEKEGYDIFIVDLDNKKFYLKLMIRQDDMLCISCHEVDNY